MLERLRFYAGRNICADCRHGLPGSPIPVVVVVPSGHLCDLIFLVVGYLQGKFLLEQQFALFGHHRISFLDEVVQFFDAVELKGLFAGDDLEEEVSDVNG